MIKITEQPSRYRHLEKMTTQQLLISMNTEDQLVAIAIEHSLAQIELLIDAVALKLVAGGRLFYIGAGTSGRLGILDASECPPTFGIAHGLIIGIIAGGDQAIRKAVEHAEDSLIGGWNDLQAEQITTQDFVIGLAASGTTPYVLEALKKCREQNISTGCITCNEFSPIAEIADFPIEIIVGPEFITGSTRLKSGTAQKLVLNMISTCCMIKIGRVEDNKMVNMQLTNDKLIDRGAKMLMEILSISYVQANSLLKKYGSVKEAISKY